MVKEIRIRCPLRPFSYLPGTKLLIPASSWQVTAYPTRLVLSFLGQEKKDGLEIRLDEVDFVKTFMVMQDLKRAAVRFFLTNDQGHFSYCIYSYQAAQSCSRPGEKCGLTLQLDRCPAATMAFSCSGERFVLQRKEQWVLPINHRQKEEPKTEEIHFGCHKTQDWDLIKRRNQLEEILPIWFALGQNVPAVTPVAGAAATHMQQLEALIEKKASAFVGRELLKLFRLFFDGIFVPYFFDVHYWEHRAIGNVDAHSMRDRQYSPLFLLTKGAALIRSLFFHKNRLGDYKILPCLPKELHAGRLIGVQATPDVTLDFEWSKKRIRRLVLTARQECTAQLRFPAGEKSFRIRTHRKDRGQRVSIDAPIFLKASERYFLDCFQR
ncbi:MAG: glycoside hydrolase family 95-like protein [Chlamydiota bacterium]